MSNSLHYSLFFQTFQLLQPGKLMNPSAETFLACFSRVYKLGMLGPADLVTFTEEILNGKHFFVQCGLHRNLKIT